jgi:hypothetical protein
MIATSLLILIVLISLLIFFFVMRRRLSQKELDREEETICPMNLDSFSMDESGQEYENILTDDTLEDLFTTDVMEDTAP